MNSVQLRETTSVFLDGSGNGVVSIGPLTAREIWRPDNVHVKVATATKEAVCEIFIGQSPDNFTYRSGTFSGSSGDSGGTVDSSILRRGDRIWARWTGGDPGAQATLTVTGMKDI